MNEDLYAIDELTDCVTDSMRGNILHWFSGKELVTIDEMLECEVMTEEDRLEHAFKKANRCVLEKWIERVCNRMIKNGHKLHPDWIGVEAGTGELMYSSAQADDNKIRIIAETVSDLACYVANPDIIGATWQGTYPYRLEELRKQLADFIDILGKEIAE